MSGGYLAFYPNYGIRLGSGYDPLNPLQGKRPAINFTPETSPGGDPQFSLSSIYVTNTTELRRAMKLDFSVDASYLTFNGGANFNYDAASFFDSSSVTIVLNVSCEYGLVRMARRPEPDLTPGAKQLIDKPDMSGFANAFGTMYAATEHRGSTVSVVVTFANLNESVRTALTGGIHAGGELGLFSAGTNSAFQSALSAARSSGKVSVQITGTGGPELDKFADVIKAAFDSDPLATLRTALPEYIRKFTVDNAAPIGFNVGEMTQFGFDATLVNLLTDEKQRRLLEMVDAYRAASGTLATIDAIAAGNISRFPKLTQTSKTEILSLRPRVSRWMSAISTKHSKLLHYVGNDLSDFDVPDKGYDDSIIPSPLRTVVSQVRISLGRLKISNNEAFDYGCKFGNCSNTINARASVTSIGEDGTASNISASGDLSAEFKRVANDFGVVDHCDLNAVIVIPIELSYSIVRIAFDFSAGAGGQFTATGGHFSIVINRDTDEWGKNASGSQEIDCTYFEHKLIGDVAYTIEYKRSWL